LPKPPSRISRTRVEVVRGLIFSAGAYASNASCSLPPRKVHVPVVSRKARRSCRHSRRANSLVNFFQLQVPKLAAKSSGFLLPVFLFMHLHRTKAPANFRSEARVIELPPQISLRPSSNVQSAPRTMVSRPNRRQL